MKSAEELAERVRRHAHGIRETNPYGQIRPSLNQESDERYDVGPWLLCPEDVKAIVDPDYFLPLDGWITYIDVQSLNDDQEYTGVFRALMVDHSFCGGERYLLVRFSVGEDEEMDLDGAETYEGKLFVLHLCGRSGRRRHLPRGCKANHRNYPCLHVDHIRRVRDKEIYEGRGEGRRRIQPPELDLDKIHVARMRSLANKRKKAEPPAAASKALGAAGGAMVLSQGGVAPSGFARGLREGIRRAKAVHEGEAVAPPV
jgi:hypothetical protein